jgi:serine/threonine protein phosphatase PrpC
MMAADAAASGAGGGCDDATHTELGKLSDSSSYSVNAVRGHRPSMEDRHCCHAVVPALNEGHAFFAVLDGHGGDAAAERVQQTLLPTILRQPALQQYISGGLTDPKLLGEAMRTGFLQCDEALRPQLESLSSSGGGTTVVSCFVTPSHLICANAGDSRAVYCKQRDSAATTVATGTGVAANYHEAPCLKRAVAGQPPPDSCVHISCVKAELQSRGVDHRTCVEKSELLTLLAASHPPTGSGQTLPLSSDHKPENAAERERITAAGGVVKPGFRGYVPCLRCP